ncbi:MAG: BlaI/MecI/CopY family transcriptional regulator [Planctomycetales bacterium]
MARTPKDVTDAELAILQVLWDSGSQTIRQLTDQIYPNGTGVHYATVQKLLERLDWKKFVKRNRTDWPHSFVAIVDRNDLINRRLRMTADTLCSGSLTPLLSNLVRASQLTAEERQSLRALLDELDGEKQPRTPPDSDGT